MTTIKHAIIAECCLDEGRPGRLRETLASARLRDPGISRLDVREWMQKHRGLRGGGKKEEDEKEVQDNKSNYIDIAYKSFKKEEPPTPAQLLAKTKELLKEALVVEKKSESAATRLVRLVKLEDVTKWLADRPPEEEEEEEGKLYGFEEARDTFLEQAYNELSEHGKVTSRALLGRARQLLVHSQTKDKIVEPKEARRRANMIKLKDAQEWIEQQEEDEEEKPLPAGKEEVIAEAFNEYHNFGNVAKTLAAARAKDKRITRADVVAYKNKYYVPLRYHRGVNSYVARKPKDEYQIDLMFFADLDKRDGKGPYQGALLAVDIFTKFCDAEPILGTDEESVLKGLKKCIERMGKPRMLYHDAESAFTGARMQTFLQKNQVQSITTLGHAPVAERTIRTIKGLLYPRVEKSKRKWWQELPLVLQLYNTVDTHRSTGMTPAEATKKENQDEVRLNLEMNRKQGRKYPPIAEGDKVRVYRKKQLGEKENVPPWTKDTWRVTSIEKVKRGKPREGMPSIMVDQTVRKLPAKKKYLMPHEVFKVPN